MADIGEKLRSAREAKGLSIQDIEKATKIQSRYLTAIENDEFDKLPGDFYVRAFIRQYAQVVGLDGKELLSEYHQDIPDSKPDEYVENSIDNKQEEVRETTNNKKDLWKNYLPKIAIGLGIIVVILIIYVVYARLSSGSQHNDNANNNVTVSSQTSSSSSKKKAKPATKKSSVKVSRLGDDEFRITGLKNNRRLVVKSGNQSVTATVSVNGVSQWSQTMAASSKHTMTIPDDATTVVVTLSNDTGSKVTVGGKNIPYTKKNSNLTLTLLIGKKTKRSSNSNSSSQTNTDSNTSTTNNGNTRQSSQTQSRTQSSTQTQTRQSSQTQSRTQSSTQTQSSQTQQSQQTQSSTAQTQQSTETTTGNNSTTGER